MKLYGVVALINLILLSPSPTPTTLPHRHYIGGVPYLRQQREYCGPATLAMVFKYYNVHIPQEELAGEIYRKELDGALNLDMLIAARKHGFGAHTPEGSLRALKEYIAREIPVIVLVSSGPDTDQYHFMVVYGYDDAKKIFRIHSGRRKAGAIGYQEFSRVWEPAGKWMLVVEQRDY